MERLAGSCDEEQGRGTDSTGTISDTNLIPPLKAKVCLRYWAVKQVRSITLYSRTPPFPIVCFLCNRRPRIVSLGHCRFGSFSCPSVVSFLNTTGTSSNSYVLTKYDLIQIMWGREVILLPSKKTMLFYSFFPRSHWLS